MIGVLTGVTVWLTVGLLVASRTQPRWIGMHPVLAVVFWPLVFLS